MAAPARPSCWLTCDVVVPLIFRHGAAATAFMVAVAAWAVFELVMTVRQHLRSSGPAALDPSALVLVPCLLAAIIGALLLGHKGGLPWPGCRGRGAWSGRSWRASS
jgi:hypothetical protein